MMNIFETDDNSTPLTEEEKQGLKAGWITTRAELNDLETKGIARAEMWLENNKEYILTEAFIKKLHKKMFGEIWKWAGIFRSSERNIGTAPYKIQEELRNLLEDTKFWIENKTYENSEIAVRFHHRLVKIHPFPNGNGRLSRLMADTLMVRLGGERFTWGSESLTGLSELRKRYIFALQKADHNDYSKLLEFVLELPQEFI